MARDDDKKVPVSPTAEVVIHPGFEAALLKAVSEVLEKTLGETIPASAGMVATIMAKAQGEQLAKVVNKDLGPRCADCGQYLVACKNKHRKAIVFPDSKAHGRWFQGVWCNGVRYLSNHGNHKITVPQDFNAEYMVSQWENNEEEVRNGRDYEHNSGQIGANSSRTNEAVKAWR